MKVLKYKKLSPCLKINIYMGKLWLHFDSSKREVRQFITKNEIPISIYIKLNRL